MRAADGAFVDESSFVLSEVVSSQQLSHKIGACEFTVLSLVSSSQFSHKRRDLVRRRRLLYVCLNWHSPEPLNSTETEQDGFSQMADGRCGGCRDEC